MAAPTRVSASGALGEAATWPWSRFAPSRPAPALAIVGVVIGIVTVVLVSSTLVGLRNSVALLFRELGTDNIFAFHLQWRAVFRRDVPGRAASAAEAGIRRARLRRSGPRFATSASS